MTIIYLEGLPGLGKTTTAVNLAAGLDRAVLVAENNPSPSRYTHVELLGTKERAHWYLETERARRAYAAAIARAAPERTVVCDKGALATLAHTYAACCIGMHPWTLYEHVRDDSLAAVPDLVPAEATVVIFTGPPSVSLLRRQDRTQALTPQRALWFDPAFLRAYNRFFEREAVALTPRPVFFVDATENHHELLVRVAATAGVPASTAQVLQAPRPCSFCYDPRPETEAIRRFATHIGNKVLGRPIGGPFTQLGRDAQAFERQLIIHGKNGQPYLQQECWESTPHTTKLERDRLD